MLKEINDLLENMGKATILVVDDQPINTTLVQSILADTYHVNVVYSGTEAIEYCQKTLPDLILMDVMMPGLDGWQTCRVLKRNPDTRRVPVIFITGLHNQEEENACWDAGGIDFLTKPFNPQTLCHRVKAQLLIKQQSDILRDMAYLDGLTRIYNRRYFDDYLKKHCEQAKRNGGALSLLMIDIDYFKQYNDHYGHLEGDNCLQLIAITLKQHLHRPMDIVARLGGEEFVCVLPNTELENGVRLAQTLRQNIANMAIEHRLSPHKRVTVSMGVSDFDRQDDWQGLIVKADEKLYEAKSAGRNAVIF